MINRGLKYLLWPALLSLIVLGLAGQTSSLVDSYDKAAPQGTSLNLPTGYVAISPVSRVLDFVSLLSVGQTVWFFVVLALLIVVPISLRGGVTRNRWLRVSIAIAAVIAGVALTLGAAIALPRPMASLRVTNPDLVRVDFHSHTNASRDANKRFRPADNREWHASGGFDIAYITDHVGFAGAAKAMKSNPARAGDSLTILSGVEGRYHRILSTIMLGLSQADTTILDGKGHLLPGTPSNGRAPVTIVAIPNGNIDSVTAESLDSLPHFAGMELVDAAPRGLGQLDREEDKIRGIAASRHLMLVSASNNHGWGRTVAAWNLMNIPGWRGLSPDSVARLIEQPFRDHQLNAVTIVKRLRPRTTGVTLPLTLPVGVYQVVGSLSLTERVVWLAWIWGMTLLVLILRRSNSRISRSA